MSKGADRENAHLVGARALGAMLDAPTLRIIDASWRLPGQDQPAAQAAYLARHLPGAHFFDIDAIADHCSPLPHMMASTDDFTRAVQAMGIHDESTIVIYDDQGLFSAPRVWWTFKAMGHTDVRVLDGGLPAWVAAGLPLEQGPARPATGTFTAQFQPAMIADADTVREQLRQGAPVLDARPAPRFLGEAPEPRANLRAGHMPGARNVPFKTLMAEAGTLRPAADLRSHLAPLVNAHIDVPPIPITSCGSGITAAVINLALTVAGLKAGRLYDGAWAEWGETRRSVAALNLYPVVGPANP
ncbi:MAG: 3-mercaptopyruvate sulfurtransferase [Pseudomonadota bacterium]